MHDMLRASHRLRFVYVRTHVHVLRVRFATVARKRRWTLSFVQGSYQRRDTYIQVVIDLPLVQIQISIYYILRFETEIV